MKLFKIILNFLVVCVSAQSFPYDRAWGTYVGGTGTLLDHYYIEGNSFFTDSQNSIYVNGNTGFQSGYTSAYYSQFAPGGTLPDTSLNSSNYSAKFSSNGQMLTGSYENDINTTMYNRLLGIDGNDSKYILSMKPGIVLNLATSGVWLSQPTNISETKTYTLSKYDANQNLLWTTYLPNSEGENFSLRFDENDNVFLLGYTNEQITNVGSSGTFQENFIPYSVSGTTYGNSYIVKLNAAGQKTWGTYSLTGITDLAYYNDALYFIVVYRPQMPGNFATAGTFQPSLQANQMIIKLNAVTGTQIWGTYYASSNSNTYTGLGMSDIEVNETGVYLCGFTEDTANPAYYATAGAFKTQLTGDGDMFLTKFTHDGNRTWSTYFGSDGYEFWLGATPLTILGNRIIFAGNQFGNTNNISTPGAFLTTIPNAGNWSMFFTEFDSSGNRLWTSYYGGQGSNFLGEYIHPELLNDGSLILWGSTGAASGIATVNGAYPTMLNPALQQPFGFIAKFTIKGLSVEDLTKTGTLQLYDNPNNGIFTVEGDILKKKDFDLKIFDFSGRLLYTEKMKKDTRQTFSYQGRLQTGTYSVQISAGKELSKSFKMIVK